MAEQEERRPAGRTEAVRSAAVQAFQATAGQAGLTRERALELADELAHAAARVRVAIDELRPATADDIRAIRDDLAALERRVSALEAPALPPKATARGATRKAASTTPAAAKPAAAKTSGKSGNAAPAKASKPTSRKGTPPAAG